MDHADHIELLRVGVVGQGGVEPGQDREPTGPIGELPQPGGATSLRPGPIWADVGAGEGAFTLALADILGPDARIIAVDRDARALRSNAAAVSQRFPDVRIETIVGDFTAGLRVPPLDGLVAANSLHFVPRELQIEAVTTLARSLRSGGAFIVVEYDADHGNPWVPHPFSATTWERMADEAGLVDTRLIGRVPSRFLGAIYSAVSTRP